MDIPQKIKNRSYDPAIPFLGTYPKEMKTGSESGKIYALLCLLQNYSN